MMAKDAIPKNCTHLNDAFNDFWFAVTPNANELIESIAPIVMSANNIEPEQEIRANNARREAWVAYDMSQLEAYFRFRFELSEQRITALIRDPDDGTLLKIPAAEWREPINWINNVGNWHIFIGADEPLPPSSFLKNFWRPIFLETDEFQRWLHGVAGKPIVSPKAKQVATEKRGRPRGAGSFHKLDEPLVDEMARLLASGEVNSVKAAAERVADKAAGSVEFASKVRRLQSRYAARQKQ